MKGTLTEVKMCGIRQRSELDKQKKTYQRTDRVTVLGLVCEKMSKRVVVARQQEEDRRTRQDTVTVARILARILEEESGKEQDKEANEDSADERDV